MRKTKIICTMGPATDKDDVLEQLIVKGMDVARFNFSHGSHEEQKVRMDKLKKLREKHGRPVAALLDTKGPEIRLKTFKTGRVELKKGQDFTLFTTDVEGNQNQVSITYPQLTNDVKEGGRILIDDGLVGLEVVSVEKDSIKCKVLNDGAISDRKGVNVPGADLSMPYMSEKDVSDILFGIEQDVDFIAASFTRSAEDVQQIRDLLKKNGGENIKIIAKIENEQGVNNVEEIINAADGVMVARGDMGVEIPEEEVPVIQKIIIKHVLRAGKIVITATQMLDSMMKNPRPTRAEAADVANAVFDGTSAVMLSGETAAGAYPIEAFTTMAKIAERAESAIDYQRRFKETPAKINPNVTDAICHSTVNTAHDLKAKAIITVTKSGFSAHMISKFRPNCDVIGCTIDDKVCRQLNLSWGIQPILLKEEWELFVLFERAVNASKEHGFVQNGDIAVLTAGAPIGRAGTTNMIYAKEID